MLTKHFHLTQVCNLPFSNIETGNGGVNTNPYSVGITISCIWHFPIQFVFVVANDRNNFQSMTLKKMIILIGVSSVNVWKKVFGVTDSESS